MEVIGRSKHVVQAKVPQVLELVGLSHKANSLPNQLSGGEQQRVAIARAFVNRPLILLCDEPTGNLDPATSQGIMRLLDRINRTETTVLMATHDASIVDTMRRRVIQLEGGELVRDQSRGVYGLEDPDLVGERLTGAIRAVTSGSDTDELTKGRKRIRRQGADVGVTSISDEAVPEKVD